MDALADDGFVVLGGPVGDLEGHEALLVVEAEDEQQVRKTLEGDPWAAGVLHLRSVRPWTIWLRSADAPGDAR